MQTINLDLSTKNVIPLLNVKQGEVGRKFKAVITDAGKPYSLAGVVFSVWYAGASGDGNYTDIGDTSAFSISGNAVTAELITQMVANAGKGALCLVMNTANGDQIATWNIPYYVEAVPGAGSQEATNYYNAFQKVLEDLPYPDTTLSIPGKAADAAAVGEALEALETSTLIPEGDDVDRFVVPGRYACETDEIAKTLQGCEVDKAFTLDVRYANGVGPHVGQELRPDGTGARLYRQFVGYSEILSEEAKSLYDRFKDGAKLQGNGFNGAHDYSWYAENLDTKTVVLTNASQLYGLADIVNGTNGATQDSLAGWTIKLDADIVINNGDASTWGDTAPAHKWTPIGNPDDNWSYKSHFAGTLDGQSHYISGLYNVQGRDNGFMCWTVNATVKNLAIINSYFENNGTNLSNTQVLCSFVGRGYGVTLKNLYSNAILVNKGKDFHTGGIAGFAKSNGTQKGITYGAATIDSVVFEGSINVNTGTAGDLVGGILGGTDGSYATIMRSLFAGTIHTNDRIVGGIVGRIYAGTIIDYCVSIGTINKGSAKPVGAVVGQLYNAGTYTITDCRYEDQGLALYGGKYNSGASATVTGSKALSAECIEHSMVPTKWAKVLDSENTDFDSYPVRTDEELDSVLKTIIESKPKNRWYIKKIGVRIPTTTVALPSDHWVITIEGCGWGNRAYITATNSFHTLKRNYVDGVFSEWGWENPPMEVSVEYRTTERYEGLPVYKKLVNIGALPNASKLTVHPFGTGYYSTDAYSGGWGTVKMRDIRGYYSGNNIPLRFLAISAETVLIEYNNGNGQMPITTDRDLSAYTAYVELTYTRTGGLSIG